MGLQAQLSALLTAGPATSDTCFPSGTRTIPISLSPSTKAYSDDSGNAFMLNSPSSFFAVPGVGAAGIVTKATTLYLKSGSQVLVQLTFANPSGTPTVIVEPLQGLKLNEYPPGYELTGLALQGTGQIEYWAAGTQ